VIRGQGEIRWFDIVEAKGMIFDRVDGKVKIRGCHGLARGWNHKIVSQHELRLVHFVTTKSKVLTATRNYFGVIFSCSS
jgi:hypothetical protein